MRTNRKVNRRVLRISDRVMFAMIACFILFLFGINLILDQYNKSLDGIVTGSGLVIEKVINRFLLTYVCEALIDFSK